MNRRHWSAQTSLSTARCVDHPDQKATHCLTCIAEAVPRPDWLVVPAHGLARWAPPVEDQPEPQRTQTVRDRADRELTPEDQP